MRELYIKLKDGGRPFPITLKEPMETRTNQFGSVEHLYSVSYENETRTLVASDALDRQISTLDPDTNVVITLTKEGDRTVWTVIQEDGNFDEKYNELKTKAVNMQGTYDQTIRKEAEGKVRHGFAVEAYKSGKKLTPETVEEINSWVQFVMSGKTDDLPF